MVPLLKGVLFMRKIWKILLIIVAILVVCLIGFVATMMYLNKSTTGDDGVAAGYAEKISFSGQLEQRYSKPGPYQVVERNTTFIDPRVQIVLGKHSHWS